MWAGVVIAVSVVITIVVVVWIGVSDKHPESAAGHSDDTPTRPPSASTGPTLPGLPALTPSRSDLTTPATR